jgi:hypothetical protein
MPTVDYLPSSVAAGANVDTQSGFAGSGYQTVGFQSGLSLSKQINKVLRQASMVAAAVANFIANTLGVNVLDDGNLPNLTDNLTAAIQNRIVATNTTPVTADAAVTTPQNLMALVFPAGVLNKVGKTLRIKSHGTFNPVNTTEVIGIYGPSSGGPVCEIKASGAGQAYDWEIEALVIVNAAGVAGNYTVTGRFTAGVGFFYGASVITPSPTTPFNFNSGAVDLTAANTWNWLIAFGTASASNIGVQDLAIMENLN